MRRPALALASLVLACFVLSACGPRRSQCPAIDQAALANRVADRVIERLRAAAEADYAAGEAVAAEAEAEAERAASQRVRVPIDDAPGIGADEPLVTLVVFSDFQCPFCARLEPTLRDVLRDYHDDVRIYFRNYPLPSHAHAHDAAEASVEAGVQGGDTAFFRFHDVLFEHHDELSIDDIVRLAGATGLDEQRMRRALVTHVHAARVDADVAIGRTLGIDGTPAVFVNGRLVSGAQPYDVFAEMIDQELTAARAMLADGIPRAGIYARILEHAGGPNLASDAAARDRVYEVPIPANAPRRGAANAQVVLQVFSDFECPFCGRLAPTLDRLVDDYGDRVTIVFRHFPLPFHAHAHLAAEAAVEVRAQRGDAAFWRYHDLLFAHQGALDRDALVRLADDVPRIDTRKLARALERGTRREAVDEEIAAGRAIFPRMPTPTTFVNGRMIRGAQPYEVYKAAVDAALAAAHP